MNYITLALVTGLVAGLLDMIPMFTKGVSFRWYLAALCTYLFAAIIVFYGDVPYLPWWADGSAVALMITIPAMLCSAGKGNRYAPVMFMNAVILGFLISVSKHFLG